MVMAPFNSAQKGSSDGYRKGNAVYNNLTYTLAGTFLFPLFPEQSVLVPLLLGVTTPPVSTDVRRFSSEVSCIQARICSPYHLKY